jgi:Hemerythrin HHE cation binding domain
MPNRNADGGRTPLTGRVDFTMMYVAHDAFTRDLQRLTAAAGAGQTASPGAQAGCAMLKKQLHIRHTTEDTSLWSALRQKVTRPDHVAVIDAMEAEHSPRIDPQLDAVDRALVTSDAIDLTQSAQAAQNPTTRPSRLSPTLPALPM